MTVVGRSNLIRRRSRSLAMAGIAPAFALIVGLTVTLSRAAEPSTEPATTQPSTQPATQPTQPTEPTDDGPAKTTSRHASADQSVESAWTTTLTAYGSSLVDDAGAATLVELTSEEAVIRQFNRAQREDIMLLRSKVLGMTVVSARAYLETPVTIASDVAADVKNASDLPEDVKRRLTPTDEPALQRANATASKWMGAALMTSGSEPVGVIVLWRPATDGTDAAENRESHPVFLLVRGESVNGQFKIRQISYGDPVPASAPTNSDIAGAGN